MQTAEDQTTENKQLIRTKGKKMRKLACTNTAHIQQTHKLFGNNLWSRASNGHAHACLFVAPWNIVWLRFDSSECNAAGCKCVESRVACNGNGTNGCSYFSHFVSSHCAFGVCLIEICIFRWRSGATEKRPADMHFLVRQLQRTQRKVQLPINERKEERAHT